MRALIWLMTLSLGILVPGAVLAEGAEQKFRQLLDPLVENGKLPAYFLGVVKDGEVVVKRGLGTAGSYNHPTPTSKTRFALLSLSKPMTVLALLRLVDQGKLRLDDPLSKYLPQFAALKLHTGEALNRPILIADLFTHTAGFGHSSDFGSSVTKTKAYQAQNLFTLSGLIDDGAPRATLSEQLEEVAKLPLINQPGVEFHYSISTDILGHVAELVTQQPLATFLRNELFVPLGMNDTGLRVSAEEAQDMARLVKPLIRTYPTPGRYRRYEPHSELPRGANNIGRGRGLSSAGSGIVSTGADCLKFLQFLLSGMRLTDGSQFISDELKDRYFNHQLNENLGTTPLAGKLPYARRDGLSFGWALRLRPSEDLLTQHAGSPAFHYWSGFSSSVMWLNLEAKTAGVFLSQITPSEIFLASRLEEIASQP